MICTVRLRPTKDARLHVTGVNRGRFFICPLINIIISTGSACTWPDDFKSSIWTDAVKGNLEFDISTMAGWDIQVENLPVNDWECFSIDAFDTEGYLEMRYM